MKKIQTLCTTLILTLFSWSAQAEDVAEGILLRGILDAGDSQVFSLSGTDGQSSRWVKIGQSFQGYKVLSFDAPSKTLSLSKDDKNYVLRLSDAKTDTANGTGDPQSRLAEAQKIMNAINFQDLIGKTLDGSLEAMKKMTRQQIEMTAPNMENMDEYIETQLKMVDEMFKGIDWGPIEKGLTKVYADTFTQSELEAISSFYASPAGQSTLEKTPEIQRKTSELMMPAIMQATQKMMQQMGGN